MLLSDILQHSSICEVFLTTMVLLIFLAEDFIKSYLQDFVEDISSTRNSALFSLHPPSSSLTIETGNFTHLLRSTSPLATSRCSWKLAPGLGCGLVTP